MESKRDGAPATSQSCSKQRSHLLRVTDDDSHGYALLWMEHKSGSRLALQGEPHCRAAADRDEPRLFLTARSRYLRAMVHRSHQLRATNDGSTVPRTYNLGDLGPDKPRLYITRDT
jgi:hypothetical protein